MKVLLEQRDFEEMVNGGGFVSVNVSAYWNDNNPEQTLVALGRGTIHLQYVGDLDKAVLEMLKNT